MSIWWIVDPDRATRERRLIIDLTEQHCWISNLEFSIKDLSFKVEFDLTHENHIFKLRLVFPSVFPDTPPMIFSRDSTRLSDHQYGNHGELCLEHRPDNWRTDITGADMIISAHRLLTTELGAQNSGQGDQEIRDGHNLTIGQELRSKTNRFLLTPEDVVELANIHPNKFTVGQLKISKIARTWVTRIFSLGEEVSSRYTSSSNFSSDCSDATCLVYFDKNSCFDLNQLSDSSVDLILSLALEQGLDPFGASRNFYLVIGNTNDWKLALCAEVKGDNKLFVDETINLAPKTERRHKAYQSLDDLKVGIVGCGSIGSKIAVQLARSGVANFELIDDDIFFEENIVRNELQLNSIGFHKSIALRESILAINPKANVFSRCIRLGGQESSAITSGVLDSLSKCNALIDATACESTFGYLASICTRNKIPLIWCSVFAGGIGGLVARSTPLGDPPPRLARLQIENAITNLGIPPPNDSGEERYAAENAMGIVEIADDSEVTLIASHAARFVLDSLTKGSNSLFPKSAYLVGFSKEWIFDEPFHTLPIELTLEGSWGAKIDPVNNDRLIEFIESFSSNEST